MRNGHVIGDYLAVDEESGRVHFASEMRRRWDGLLVHESNWETRQPQEFVEARNDPEVLRDVSPRVPPPVTSTSVPAFVGQTTIQTPIGPASHLFQVGLGEMVIDGSNEFTAFIVS